LLAASGEHLPALPQTDRVLESALPGLQAPHHLDELVAGRLVGQLGDVRGQGLRPLGGGDRGGRCVVGIALDGGEVVLGAAVRGHRGSSVGSDGTGGDGCAGSAGCGGGMYGSDPVRSAPRRPPATRTERAWPISGWSGERMIVPSASWTTAYPRSRVASGLSART